MEKLSKKYYKEIKYSIEDYLYNEYDFAELENSYDGKVEDSDEIELEIELPDGYTAYPTVYLGVTRHYDPGDYWTPPSSSIEFTWYVMSMDILDEDKDTVEVLTPNQAMNYMAGNGKC